MSLCWAPLALLLAAAPVFVSPAQAACNNTLDFSGASNGDTRTLDVSSCSFPVRNGLYSPAAKTAGKDSYLVYPIGGNVTIINPFLAGETGDTATVTLSNGAQILLTLGPKQVDANQTLFYYESYTAKLLSGATSAGAGTVTMWYASAAHLPPYLPAPAVENWPLDTSYVLTFDNIPLDLTDPTISAAFSPTAISTSGASTLTLTITNTNASAGLTGIAVAAAALPANLTGSSLATTCGGTASFSAGQLSLSGGSLAAGTSSSCTVTLSVSSTVPGSYGYTTGAVSTTETGAGLTSATPTSLKVYAPPTISAAFGTSPITTAGNTTLTITLANPVGNPGAISGMGFAASSLDGLTGSLNTNGCGGTTSIGANVSHSGGSSLSAGASCTIVLDVSSVSAGTYDFTPGAPSATSPATLTGVAGAQLTLQVNTPPSLALDIGHTGTPAQGGTFQLTANVGNGGGTATSGNIAFTSTLTTGLSYGGSATGTNWDCTGSSGVNLSCVFSGAIPASGSNTALSVTIAVAAASPTSKSITATVTGGGASGSANDSDTFSVVQTPASVTIGQGSSQSALVSTAFTTEMRVVVKDAASVLIPGRPVTFTAPGAGASGTFGNATNTITVNTDANGIAAAGTFTANGIPGDLYNVSATAGSASTQFTLTNTPPALTATQAVASVTGPVGTALTAVIPVTGAGGYGTLSYALSGGTLPAGLTFDTGTGELSGTPTAALVATVFTVTVSDQVSPTAQTASDIFTLTVNAVAPGAPTIGMATAGDTEATVTFTAPASNGGNAITGYTVTASGGATATGGASPITVTGLTNGTAYTFTVTANNGVGTSLPSAASNSVTPKGSQTITFANPGSQNFGTTPMLSASASSGLDVVFSSTTPGVCITGGTNGATLTFGSIGTCTVVADQAGSAAFTAASTISQSFSVNAVAPGAPTIGTATAGDAAATVTFTAPASNGGDTITLYTVTSSPPGGAGTGTSSPIVVAGLTNGTAYTFTVTATNGVGTSLPSAASNSVTPKGSQTITFANPGSQNFGTTPTLTATASSNLDVVFSSTTPGVCITGGTNGVTLTFGSTGTCTIVADQAGSAAFTAASTVSQSFSVNAVAPGAPTIGTATAGDAAATVTFTAPASNGGDTITLYTVTSSPPGGAGTGTSSPIVVAGLTNGTAYTFTVTATNGVGTSLPSAASNSVTPKGSQTITFVNPGGKSFGTTPTLTASATSGLDVVFSSSTMGVCATGGTNGVTLTFGSTGTCTVVASQLGNANFAPATTVTQSFTVTPGSNVITFPALANTAFTSAPPVLAATASSNLPVTYASTTGTVCTIAPGGTISFGSVGTCTIKASQAGNTNFVAANDVSQSFNVTPGVNTITFPALANTAFASAPPVLAATASSNLPVTYASTTGTVCTVTPGGTISFGSVGTCTIKASQAGNTNFVAANDVSQSFNVTSGTNTITFPALANTAFTATPPVLAATASSNLPVTYASTTEPVCLVTSSGVITFAKTGTCTITASQPGNANFAAATAVSRSFNVTPGTNTITFPALANTAFTATPPIPAATSSSKLAVTYASTTTPVCTATSAGAITFVKAGTCTISASQAGDANFAAATVVTRSFNVTPGTNTITFPALANTAFSAKPPVLAATASSKLAVTYASTTTPICTVTSAGVITFVKAGTCTITASQPGDASFAAATAVSRSFTVLATVTVVTTSSKTPAAYGVPVTFTAKVTVPAGGAATGTVTFKDGGATLGVATLTNGTATLTTATLAVGAHSITAAYDGSATQGAGVSAPLAQVITKANPVLTLVVTPNPVEAGQPVTLAATLAVTPVPATGPSGSIVFRDGATVIGSTTILAGKAAFSISTLAPGGHSLTASYAGDARFAAVTSASMPLTVQRSCKDAFASATAFGEATGSASGSTATATGETGEGRHGGDTGAINSVWCKWTAPAAGRVTIDTTGSTFDTTLAVYTGTAIGQLTKVAANDNIDAATRQSRVAFTAVQGKAYMIAIDGAGAARGAYVLNWTQTPAAPKLYAAVLPASRSIQTGSTATAFATIINSGNATATGCGIALPAGFPAAFSFQTTNAANVSTGTVATAVNIPAGGIQRFVFGVTPTNAMEAAEIPLVFDCANTQPAPSVAGLNRFTLTAAAAPSPDIIAIASTILNDGIVTIPASGPGLFTAASLNIGAAGTLTVQADDGGSGLPLTLTLCRSDPKTGACAAGTTPKPSLRIAYGASATVTFTVFAKATGTVAFDPALNRIQLRWKTADGITRGITSVAVRTQ